MEIVVCAYKILQAAYPRLRASARSAYLAPRPAPRRSTRRARALVGADVGMLQPSDLDAYATKVHAASQRARATDLAELADPRQGTRFRRCRARRSRAHSFARYVDAAVKALNDLDVSAETADTGKIGLTS